jgi:hypothetical protein
LLLSLPTSLLTAEVGEKALSFFAVIQHLLVAQGCAHVPVPFWVRQAITGTSESGVNPRTKTSWVVARTRPASSLEAKNPIPLFEKWGLGFGHWGILAKAAFSGQLPDVSLRNYSILQILTSLFRASRTPAFAGVTGFEGFPQTAGLILG